MAPNNPMFPPRISVVIPLYNHERYIEAALDSALCQSVPAAEIIVVDDGSTDASAAKVRALCASHPQIIFWSQPNQGAPYTLNAGILRATGEFVSILNSDDVYCPTRFEECLNVLRHHPDVSAVATGLTFIDDNSVEISNQWYEDARSFYNQAQDFPLALIHGNFFVSTSNVFARRAVFDEVGYFSPLRYAHDLDFFLRLLGRGKAVRFLEQPLLRYRSHAANTIKENDRRVRVERAAAIASFILNAWREHSEEPHPWRAYLEKIAEITEGQGLTGLVDHFLARYEFLALPRLGRTNSPFRSLPRPLANELTANFPFHGLRQPLANEMTLADLSERIAREEETVAALRGELEEKRIAFARQEENIAALREELKREQLEKKREQLEKRIAFARQEENIAALREELKREQLGRNHAEAELAAWKQTRFHRLWEVWSSGGATAGKCATTLYFLAAWAAPEWLKRPLRPFIQGLGRRSHRVEEAGAGVSPYRVRIPAPRVLSRPRVVHAIANFLVGGSSRLVVDLIEHLGDRYEQEVITSHIPSPPAYTGLPIQEYRDLGDPKALKPYFERFRPDLVHVHYWGDCDRRWYEAALRAAREYGCRIIENVNTPVEPYFDDKIAHYVYVSDYVLDHFGRRDARSSVIHPGSNFDIFTARRSELPQPDCIGMVYRLEGDKLNEKSIDVFVKVVQRRPGTRALIVGGGTFLERYKAAVAAAGVSDAFTFSGYVPYDELPRLYSQMTLFVAPVWQESFGQVSPFAMSMGMPVVGYDVGALSEIIGTREFLAPPGDADRLAGIIIDLLANPDRILAVGQANQARAHSRFSVQAMIDRYAELYQQVLR